MRTDGENVATTSCALHNKPVIKIIKRNCKRKAKTPWKFHSCKQCSYKTTLFSMFYNHKKRHDVHHDLKIFNCTKSTVEKYKCTLCSDENATSEQALLKRHMKIFHRIQLGKGNEKQNIQENSYSCRNCDFKTYSQLVYICHYSKCYVNSAVVEDDIEYFKCSKCPYSTSSEKLLDNHKRRKHPVFVDNTQQNSETEPIGNMIRLLLCDWCDFFTTKQSTLKKHMMDRHDVRENDEIMYACKECSFKTKLQVDLYNHVRNTHICGKFICEYCPFYTNQKQLLDVHMATYPHFDSVEIIENELNTTQPDKELENGQREENEEIVYLDSCEELSATSELCDSEENPPDSIFSESQNLETEKSKEHFLRQSAKELENRQRKENGEIVYLDSCEELPVSSELRDTESQNLETSECDKMNKCELCSSQYALRVALMKHMFNKHPARAEQIYLKCPKCRFRATTDELLHRHMKTRHKSEISKCDVDNVKEKKSLFAPRQLEWEKHNEKILSSSSSGELYVPPKFSKIFSSSSGELSIASKFSDDVEENQPLSELTQAKHPTMKKDTNLKCPKCHFRTMTVKLLKTHLHSEHKIKFIEWATDNNCTVKIMENELLKKKSTPKTADKSKDRRFFPRLLERKKENEIIPSSSSSGELSMSSKFSDDVEENQPLSSFAQAKHPTMKKHINLKCPKCQFRAITVKLLKIHLHREHEIKFIGPSKKKSSLNTTDESDDSSLKRSNKIMYKKTVKQGCKGKEIYVKCPNCSFRTARLKLLKTHIQREHKIKFIEWATDAISNVEMMEDEQRLRRFNKRNNKTILVLGENHEDTMSSDSFEELSVPCFSSDFGKNHPFLVFPNSKDLQISKSYKMYKCELCASKYLFKETLMKHMFYKHPKTANLQCCKCRFQTTTVQSLKKHLRLEHKKVVACGTYNKEREKQTQPTVVLERLKMQKLRRSRTKNDQGLVQKQATYNEGRKWLECESCPFKSIDCSELKLHILTAHVAAESVICFKCQLCTFRTLEEDMLREHILEKHIDPLSSDCFTCDMCSNIYEKIENLRKHIFEEHIL